MKEIVDGAAPVRRPGSISAVARQAMGAKLSDAGWYRVVFLATAAFGVFLSMTLIYPFRRADYFLLADALLHGRTWIEAQAPSLPEWDLIQIHGHTYLPFGPGPALLVLPFVMVLGPLQANAWQPVIDSAIAALNVALLLLLVRRVQPSARWNDAVWVVALLGLSLPMWWVTVRMGPWHFAQLAAVASMLVAVLELLGKRRPWLIGVAFGMAILSRITLVVAIPFVFAVLLFDAKRRGTKSAAIEAAVMAIFPLLALALTAGYNALRFGSPLESGYALASLPPFLNGLRSQGLFSLSHVPYNLELMFLHLPVPAAAPFFLRPDGFGLTVALSSPGLALIIRAQWSRPLVRWAAATGIVVLVPSLLYYGGGWIQLGFRYLLDALPFIAVLAASAIRTPVRAPWKVLIAFGVAVNLWGIAWGYTPWLQ
jgi:hypothetical protein